MPSASGEWADQDSARTCGKPKAVTVLGILSHFRASIIDYGAPLAPFPVGRAIAAY
jgi:hypothetical protein